MRTFATKQPTNQDATHQKPVKATPVPVTRSLSTGLTGSAMVQRQPGCACGGGCPRCKEQGLLQTKLKIGEPGDQYEQEADRIADQVMRMPEPRLQRQAESAEETGEEPIQTKSLASQITPLIQRQAEEEEEEPVQAKLMDAQIQRQVQGLDADLERQIDSLHGGGIPMTDSELAFFEPRFGWDFSRVRMHTDRGAQQSAQAMNAHAYTFENHIVFASERYRQGSPEGRRIIAHELAHVVQQSRGAPAKVIRRAETDTRGLCIDLADGSNALNTFVNEQIRAAYTAAILPKGSGTLLSPLNPMEVVDGTYKRLGVPDWLLPHLTVVGDWAKDNLPNRSHGLGGYFGLGSSKYRHASGTFLKYLAPAVNLNGYCVGIDKIDHMFQQGYEYFQKYSRVSASTLPSLGAAAASKLGERYARAYGEWTEGVLSPATRGDPTLMAWLSGTGVQQGIYGIASTGVHSRADLAANEAGLRFYRDLLASPSMTFDIKTYVSADWDEENIGNIYRNDIGTAVGKAGRLNPADVVLPP